MHRAREGYATSERKNGKIVYIFNYTKHKKPA